MRLKSLLAACAALACIGVADPQPAAAFGDRDQPDGWNTVRPIRHWVYYPRYAHNYHVDPYAYQYSPRRYYPYNSANYWQPARTVRKRNHQHYNHWNVQAPRYKYYPSWGYSKNWDQHEYVPSRHRHVD